MNEPSEGVDGKADWPAATKPAWWQTSKIEWLVILVIIGALAAIILPPVDVARCPAGPSASTTALP